MLINHVFDSKHYDYLLREDLTYVNNMVIVLNYIRTMGIYIWYYVWILIFHPVEREPVPLTSHPDNEDFLNPSIMAGWVYVECPYFAHHAVYNFTNSVELIFVSLSSHIPMNSPSPGNHSRGRINLQITLQAALVAVLGVINLWILNPRSSV